MPLEPEEPNESTEEVDYEPLFNQLRTERSAFSLLLKVLAWRVRVPQWFVASYWLSLTYLVAGLLLQNSWTALIVVVAVGTVLGVVLGYFLYKTTDESLPVIGGEPVSRRTHTVTSITEVMLMGFTIFIAVGSLFSALLS